MTCLNKPLFLIIHIATINLKGKTPYKISCLHGRNSWEIRNTDFQKEAVKAVKENSKIDRDW